LDMSADTLDPLIDRIYESCVVPELWPGTLDDIAKLAGARTGWLFTFRQNITRWAASNPQAAAILGPLINTGWVEREQRFLRLLASRHSGFLVDLDIFTPEELETDPTYLNILRPAGLGWGAGTAIPFPTGDNLVLSIEREYTRGPVEQSVVQQLDSLRPHIARGALIAARLQLERARAISETLSIIGLPALVLSGQEKVLAANTLIEGLTTALSWGAQDRIMLRDATADRQLHAAMATLDRHKDAQPRSFPVHAEDSMMVAHLIPIRRSARDIFAQCAAILILTTVTRPDSPPIELVRSLFDLTAAEARVARALASGDAVDAIATAGGVSLSTVRTHVRGALEKTGCHRQADLIALLNGIWSPPSPTVA
jgi:DNA-binding CsgD family transcriptional regulator